MFESYPGFQCTEFANRFLFIATGGDDTVADDTFNDDNLVGGNFVATAHAKYLNLAVGYSSTKGAMPAAGDIISMWNGTGSTYGPNGSESHVAVVTDVPSRSAGGWTITVLSENDALSENTSAPSPGKPGYGFNYITLSQAGAWSFNNKQFTQFDWLELVASPAIATAVMAHYFGYCALLTSQQVECWGTTQFGLLGDGGEGEANYEEGTLQYPFSPVPVDVQGLSNVRSLGIGLWGENTCALLFSGKVECWGSNGGGALGNGGKEIDSNVPVPVAHIANATSVYDDFANGATDCAILSTGHVDCWGSNADGQLGDGTDKSSSVPVPVRGITNATSLSGGQYSVCALLATGGVDCWGANDYGGITGALGNGGGEANSYVPVKVRGITDVTGIFGGGAPFCAILASGGVDCWGSSISAASYNENVALGSDVPVVIHDVAKAKSLTVGSAECALLTTGGVDCWGSNSEGQLGDHGVKVAAFSAVAVSGLKNAEAIAGSDDGTVCALRTSGTVSCWGNDTDGELGNGSKDTTGWPDASAPVPVSGLDDAVSITAAFSGFCALLKTGGVDCWGMNPTQPPSAYTASQYSTVPVPVSGLGS